MKLSPTTDNMPSTPGIGLTTSSTCFTISSVRLIEAPSGSRMAAKIAPWSSSGRKLCGVRLNRSTDAASDAGDDEDADDRDAHQPAHHTDVTVANAIDGAEHVAHRAAGRLAALE